MLFLYVYDMGFALDNVDKISHISSISPYLYHESWAKNRVTLFGRIDDSSNDKSLV